MTAVAGNARGASLTPEVARQIKLVGLDVDGVLTDGGIYLGDVNGQRMEFKRFDILDGVGIKMLQSAGIAVPRTRGSGRHSGRTGAQASRVATTAGGERPR